MHLDYSELGLSSLCLGTVRQAIVQVLLTYIVPDVNASLRQTATILLYTWPVVVVSPLNTEPRFGRLHYNIRQKAIHQHGDNDRPKVQGYSIFIHMVHLKDLLTGTDCARPIVQPLVVIASKHLPTESKGHDIPNDVSQRGDFVNALEESWHICIHQP